MYKALVVCSIPGILASLQRYIPEINPEIEIVPASNEEEMFDILDNGYHAEVVVCEHNNKLDAFKIYDDLCKSLSFPPSFIITTDNTKIMNAVKAFEYRIDYFIYRSSTPMDFHREVAQKIVLSCERHRSAENRAVNLKRLNAVNTLAEIRDHPFSEVLSYALETSIKLTGSSIGYVATYNHSSRKLNIISWSFKAMDQCRIVNRPMEYDLDSSGLWGEPIRLLKPIIINDYDSESKFKKNGLPAGHVELKNILMIPIIRNGKPVATAGVGNKNGDYTEEDRIQTTLLMDSLISIYLEKITQNESHKSEAIARELLETTHNGIVLVEKDFRFKACNAIAGKLLNIEDPAALKGRLSDFLMDKTALMVYNTISEAFASDKDVCRRLLKDSVLYAVSVKLGKDAAGKTVSALATIINVTELTTMANLEIS